MQLLFNFAGNYTKKATSHCYASTAVTPSFLLQSLLTNPRQARAPPLEPLPCQVLDGVDLPDAPEGAADATVTRCLGALLASPGLPRKLETAGRAVRLRALRACAAAAGVAEAELQEVENFDPSESLQRDLRRRKSSLENRQQINHQILLNNKSSVNRLDTLENAPFEV